jgi:hypothetical protein
MLYSACGNGSRKVRNTGRSARHFLGYLFFYYLGSILIPCTISESLLSLWHHFWSQFCYLGVTFITLAPFWGHFCSLGSTLGALWMHFSHQKSDLVAKGAPRGATLEINSLIWRPFGDTYSCIFAFVRKKNVFEIRSCFSSISRSPWSLHGVGSYAIRTRLCSPNTLFSCSNFSINMFPEGCKWS